MSFFRASPALARLFAAATFASMGNVFGGIPLQRLSPKARRPFGQHKKACSKKP